MPRVPNIQHLVAMFDTASDLADAVGINRSAVSRWVHKGVGVSEDNKLAILRAGLHRGMDLAELLRALDFPVCECCGKYLSKDVREAVGQ